MNKNWPQISLGNVLKRVKDEVAIEDEQIYARLTIRMNGKGIVLRDRVPGFEIGTKRQFLARTGQLVLSKIDARNGAFGIVSADGDNAVITGNFWLFDADKDRLLPAYFNYLTKTPTFVEFCLRASEGTTNRRYLQEDQFLAQTIMLPPLAEQQRVVARIEELSATIQEARLLRQQAAEEVKVLWRLGASRVLERAEKDFPLRTLSDAVVIRGGGTPSKANPFYWSGPIPWVTPKDMKVREIYDAVDHISDQATAESPAKLIDPGAVLIVVRGMILLHTVPSAVLRVPATINQDMKALIPRPGLLPEYLCALLWALNKRFLVLVEKSTHDTRKLETPVLLRAEIPVPPLSEQCRIVSDLDRLQAEIDALKHKQAETAAELDALIPSILDKAFRGEL